MAEPFLSEIRLFSFQFAPRGWALCDGQLLPSNQNQARFSLLGNTYGGDARTNFALPGPKGRVPVLTGPGHDRDGLGGEATHTLAIAEVPAHAHVARASAAEGAHNVPAGDTGSSQAHPNRQPYLALNFCIALQGVFPQLP